MRVEGRRDVVRLANAADGELEIADMECSLEDFARTCARDTCLNGQATRPKEKTE